MKLLLSGHLQDLLKCPLNRGCLVNRGLQKLHNFCQRLTFNILLLCTVIKFHVVKDAKEAVLYFVQDF